MSALNLTFPKAWALLTWLCATLEIQAVSLSSLTAWHMNSNFPSYLHHVGADADFSFKGSVITVLAKLLPLGLVWDFEILQERDLHTGDISIQKKKFWLFVSAHHWQTLNVGGRDFKLGEMTSYSPKSDFIIIWHFAWWNSKGQNVGIHICLENIYHIKGTVKRGEVGNRWE